MRNIGIFKFLISKKFEEITTEKTIYRFRGELFKEMVWNKYGDGDPYDKLRIGEQYKGISLKYDFSERDQCLIWVGIPERYHPLNGGLHYEMKKCGQIIIDSAIIDSTNEKAEGRFKADINRGPIDRIIEISIEQLVDDLLRDLGMEYEITEADKDIVEGICSLNRATGS